MNHELYEELLATEVIGVLTAEERITLAAHLAGCRSCQDLKASFAVVAKALPSAAEPRVPPANLKRRIMAEIDSESHAPIARPWWQTQWTFALSAIALVVALAPLYLKPVKIGTINSIQGSLLINGRPAAAGQIFRQGQRLTTDATSAADLWLSNRVLVKIKSEADVSVRLAKAGFELTLDKGAAFSLVKSGTPYAVITPSLRTEALGTVFFVETQGAEKTYVCICNGHIGLSGAGLQQDLEAEHHKAVFATQQLNRVELTEGTLIDHSDEEFGLLSLHFK